MTLRDQLEKLDACSEARDWAGGKTLEQAWLACERGDWMLWYAHRVGVSVTLIAGAAYECLESAPVNNNEFSRDGYQYARSLAGDIYANGSRGEVAVYAALRTCWGREVDPSLVYLTSDDDSAYSSDRAALNKKFCDIIRRVIPIEVLLLAPVMAKLAEMEHLLK